MASNEITSTNDPSPRRFGTGESGSADRVARIRRVTVFVVVALALVVALWALTQGGSRDLWRSPDTDTATLEALLLWTVR